MRSLQSLDILMHNNFFKALPLSQNSGPQRTGRPAPANTSVLILESYQEAMGSIMCISNQGRLFPLCTIVTVGRTYLELNTLCSFHSGATFKINVICHIYMYICIKMYKLLYEYIIYKIYVNILYIQHILIYFMYLIYTCITCILYTIYNIYLHIVYCILSI